MTWVFAAGIVPAGVMSAAAGIAPQATRRAQMSDGAQARRVDGGVTIVLVGLVGVLVGLGHLGVMLLAPH